MDKFELGEISLVDRPAQETALAAIEKSEDGDMEDDVLKTSTVDDLVDGDVEKQRGPRPGETFRAFLARMRRDNEDMDEDEARRMFERANSRTEKRGDLVSILTSSNEGHQHGVSIYHSDDGMVFMVGYAAGPEGEPHDHQIAAGPDGMYVMSENRGHTHTIDQMALQSAMTSMLVKQGPSRAERDRAAAAGQALPDGSFPIRNATDLGNAIQAFGRANPGDRRRVARHIRRRARALNMTDRLPTEGVLADLLKADDSSEINQDEVGKMETGTGITPAELERLRAIAAMSGVHKSHFDGLPNDAAKDKFIAADISARDAMISLAKAAETEANPIVYTAVDGTEYRKSDDPRLVAMAKGRDEDRRESQALRATAIDADLTRRAEGEFANLPGDLETRKSLIKAVDGIADEAQRTAATAALKAQNAKLHSAFETVGTSATPSDVEKANDRKGAEAELDRLAKAHQEEKKVDYYTAYDEVSKANPDLLRKAIG